MATRKPYAWNARAARYRDLETGRFLSRDQVRLALDRLIQASQQRVFDASNALRSGSIDLAEWQALMRQEIKRTMLSSEALLRGGWSQLTNSEYGRVGAHVRIQYRFLDNFTQQIRDGSQALDGQFLNRARMYAAAARIEFHEAQTQQLTTLGYTEERNVLHPAEHCELCIEMSALGWVPIGTLIPIGQRTCRGNDRCSMRYR